MKCTRGREPRLLVCLHVFRPSRVISTVELNRSAKDFSAENLLYVKCVGTSKICPFSVGAASCGGDS